MVPIIDWNFNSGRGGNIETGLIMQQYDVRKFCVGLQATGRPPFGPSARAASTSRYPCVKSSWIDSTPVRANFET